MAKKQTTQIDKPEPVPKPSGRTNPTTIFIQVHADDAKVVMSFDTELRFRPSMWTEFGTEFRTRCSPTTVTWDITGGRYVVWLSPIRLTGWDAADVIRHGEKAGWKLVDQTDFIDPANDHWPPQMVPAALANKKKPRGRVFSSR